MKVALGSDHRGYHVNPCVRAVLEMHGAEVIEFAGQQDEACDYPDRAYPVAKAVADGEAELGVLLCGTGIGMSIAANKMRGVRAALVHDEISAEMARRHNDANVICVSADLLGPRMIERLVEVWLTGVFEAGRHARRVTKIDMIERGEDPRTLEEDATVSG